MVEALVAGDGFRRVAAIAEEAVGAPVEILLPRPGSEGLQGTAAERYVAALVAGEDPTMPAGLGAVVPIEAAGDLHGAVVMLEEGRPGAEEHLRAAASASLTGVAILNAREEANRTADGLLADLVRGHGIPPGEVLRRARSTGCDLALGFCAVCVDPGTAPTRGLLGRISAAYPEALVEICLGRIYVLLPGATDGARQLTGELGEEVVSAFSSHYREAGGARDAIEEAELLLAMVEAGGRRDTARATWDSIRLIYRSFVTDPLALADFAERSIGAVIRQDEAHGAELEATFWVFQESNGNMNVTARETYTHRHTVSNRLAKIAELTGLDPLRSHDRELLSMAFKANMVLTLSRRRV